MGATSVATRGHAPPPLPLDTARAKRLALAALGEEAAIRLTQELVERLGRAAVLGPEAPYIFRIHNFYLQEITIKLDRAHTALKWAKEQVYASMEVVKDQKEFKQARLVADVDPM